jgi:hypothetical protein
MNEFMSLNDYYVSTRPSASVPASATRPCPPHTTAPRRSVRRTVASGLYRLADRFDD